MARLFQRKPGGIFYIDYCIQGRRIRESTGTSNRKQAERCLYSRQGEIVQGKFKLESLQRAPLFREFSSQYLDWAKENKRSWDRDEYALKKLIPELGHIRLTEIHPFRVESYKIKRKGQVKPATVNREIALLKRMLNLAVKWRLIQTNPIRDVKFFQEPRVHERFLTREEGTRLINACTEPLKWIVITALHTGMRRGEILNLRWEHVDLREGLITVVETKNGETRHVLMNETVRSMLAELTRRSEFVFIRKNGKPYTWIGRAWNSARNRAGVHCRFHDLRHTYASHLVMNGVDLMTVKELLGHKTLAMVQRYAHLSYSHKQKAVGTLDSLFSENDGTNMAHLPKMAKVSSL